MTDATMQGTTQAAIALHDSAVDTHTDHHAHPDLRPFGLIVFLISEAMLFGGIFAHYVMTRLAAPAWPPEGVPELELTLPAVNTLILVTSSLVIHQADDAIRKNKIGTVRAWLFATFLMGAVFIAGQAYEYMHMGYGLTANIFANLFYIMTGFHGFHVLIGLTIIAVVLLKSLKPNYYSAQEHFGIAAASIYWHFVDIVWVVLFAILYLWR